MMRAVKVKPAETMKKDPDCLSKPPPTAGEVLKSSLIHYCENTSIHGFSYLPGPHPSAVNWCERIFWAVVIVCGFTVASFIINQAFTEWADNPTIVTTTTYSKPITDVQARFPCTMLAIYLLYI